MFDSKFSQDSLKTPERISNDSRESRYKICLRDSRVLLQNLSARRESCYEISFCETRKKRFSIQNFVARLAFRVSCYKISVCETHEKRVSLLILTRESRENLARILGLKSESRFSQEFQKVILVSTLLYTEMYSRYQDLWCYLSTNKK